jgi:hypothetical protein
LDASGGLKVSGTDEALATGTCCAFGLAWTATTRICSPVRLKKCWNMVPPQVATPLTTPAPRIVP